jgi:putative membrane protein
MMGNAEMAGWGGMIFGPLLMIALLALIVFAIVRLLSPNRRRQADPVSLLEKRFASGEITAAEFEQGKRVLNGRGPG